MAAPVSPVVASTKSEASTPVTGSVKRTANWTLAAFVHSNDGLARVMLETAGRSGGACGVKSRPLTTVPAGAVYRVTGDEATLICVIQPARSSSLTTRLPGEAPSP